MKSPQFYVVALLLMLAIVELRLRGDVDRVPPSQPLNQLATTIGPWQSRDIPMDDEVLQVLGKGVFLNRVYSRVSPNDSLDLATEPHAKPGAEVGLFIGYFPTQRTGQAIHSPQNCLPGAGYVFVSSGVTNLVAQGKKYTVGDYLISDGKSNDEVLYWYKLHGRSIASDYKAKLYTLADSVRYSRTDAALVRVITPVLPGETRADAHDRAVGFAQQLVPLLPPYIPD